MASSACQFVTTERGFLCSMGGAFKLSHLSHAFMLLLCFFMFPSLLLLLRNGGYVCMYVCIFAWKYQYIINVTDKYGKRNREEYGIEEKEEETRAVKTLAAFFRTCFFWKGSRCLGEGERGWGR